jgi:CO/xanthine dehydrogenase Mo-binding subunit
MEIGKEKARVDANAKVRGEALYPGDYNLDNQVYMKVLFSKKAHAIIKSVDVSKAERVAGVIGILLAADVPNNEYGLGVADQPVLCGIGSNRAHADRVKSYTDQIACVLAETEEIAKSAMEKIEVEYQDLPVISSVQEALQPGAFVIHPEKESNVLLHYNIIRGDISAAFRNSDVIVESIYKTPVQEHAYLQPEAGISYIDENGCIVLIVGGQWIHEDQEQVAHALNLPLDKIRVIYPAIGGAFGGREDMSVQITLSLAALKLHERGINRPVKIIWSREESMIGHHKRHAYELHSKWGATKEGKILAAEVKIYADAGAYTYTSPKVQGNATLMCTGPYEIPNVRVDSYSVFTNNLPGGAFRGFGGPQAAFAAETQMNKLAEMLQMDVVELRMRNLIKEGSYLSVGSMMPAGVSLPEVVKSCAERSGWKNAAGAWEKSANTATGVYPKVKGTGFACSYKNIGFSFGAPEQCWATVELVGGAEIEKVILKHAGAEVGQGAHTAFTQMVAEAVGVPMELVELIPSDTATSDNSGSVSASRMTFMAGNSIIGAAKLAMEKWNNEERPAIAKYRYVPPKTSGYSQIDGSCDPNFAYGYASEAVTLEVDLETGQIDLLNVICADDVGKAINPQMVVGQIEGAIVQAAGYTLLENFIQDQAVVKTSQFSTYLIPTVLDIPEKIDSLVLEYPDPNGPWGARGVGEMPYMPFAPAVIAAVHDATGIWFDEFPLTPERVLKGLGKLED